jgi:Flp pilus assembly pilin Flp
MRAVMGFLDRLAADDSGATMVEYTILMGLLTAVALATLVIAVLPKITAIWNRVNSAMTNAAAGS